MANKGSLNDKPSSSFIIEEFTVVYTKGSFRNNGKSNAKAGIGVWFNKGHHLNVSKLFEGRITNSNTPDIQAAVRAITIARESGIKSLKIKTDCRFVIEVITNYIDTWKRNDWKKNRENESTNDDIKNKDDFIELDSACQLLDHVVWQFVKKEDNPAGKLAKLATY